MADITSICTGALSLLGAKGLDTELVVGEAGIHRQPLDLKKSFVAKYTQFINSLTI